MSTINSTNSTNSTNRTGEAEIKSALLWAALSFAVPAAVLTVIMAVCGIAPFGDHTLINDANAAWFESFTGMYRSIVSGEGIFYHLNVGFGTSFYSDFASGLCSPFLFFAFFFGQRSLAAAYTLITVVRAGAAGAAGWYMLRKCSGIGRSMCFALSCGYSLCGFTAFAAYYPSVVDGAVFMPLLVAGIYSYVQASRPVRLFVFGTVFFLTCSRLTLLGIIISLTLYAAFYIRRGSQRQRVYKLALFAATLLCSAGVNAVLVIPVWKGSIYYQNGVFSAMQSNDILSDLCFGGYATVPTGGVGMCLAGLLLIGFFSFLFNANIGAGEKIAIACGMGALVLCHAIPPLARLFLGFGNAGGEYVSAGFMLALLAVYGTARSYTEREGLSVREIAFAAGIYLALAVISLALRADDGFAVLAESGLGILACAVFVQMCVCDQRNVIKLSAATAAALVLFGAVHCAGATGRIHSEVTASSLRMAAESRTRANHQLEESYREKNEEVPRFYRTRSTDGFSDSVDINRNEVEGLTAFAERLGIMRNSQYGGADNFTEFTDILFGIAKTDFGYFTKEAIRHKACSPAYLIGRWDNQIPDGLNAFEVQNYLAKAWFDVTPFVRAEPAEHTRELSSESERYKWTFGNENTVVDQYTFELSETDSLYMLVQDMDYSYAIGSDSRSDWRGACAGGIFRLTEIGSGLMKAGGGGVKVTVYLSADASKGTPVPVFMICRADIDAAVLSKCADYISYRGSTVRFMFDISRDQLAITSIPYESGWNITVNGRSVEPVELCGGLIGLRLEKGANSVVMTYMPPYFCVSMWISVILFAVGLYITIRIEHEAARRRKVRMAFRAVELNISRMTVDQLGNRPDEAAKSESMDDSSDINHETALQNKVNEEIQP